jgi:beta-glucanase (GH16 family)
MGYREAYKNDFSGNHLPLGWDVFNGVPGGDPGGQFNFRHVLVAQGLLRLKVWQDPRFEDRWVTGGVCQCGQPLKYGAFFVRSRLTGAGANTAELLWPVSNSWPPEIDFNENLSHVNLTTATLHWGPGNNTDFQILRINMLKWHTWGVIWTPESVTYVVDGRPWHVVTTKRNIPTIPMDLNLEQRTNCTQHYDCPGHPSALLVDWVVEYTKS